MREALLPILRAATATALIVGTVLFLVNPPSLSGAEELVTLLAGAAALVITTAWLTVILAGRDGPSEREFERVVVRSEELARRTTSAGLTSDFDELVAEAIERLPEEFRSLLETTPVIVSQRGAEAGAYGHYFGDTVARDNFEDRIVLYQDTLERDFGWDRDLLSAQVERTLRHEVAHHLGWAEQGVRDLGL